MDSTTSETLEVDKAAEAREARRKRILENSNKRLGKITGREHNDGKNFYYANFPLFYDPFQSFQSLSQ